MKKPEGKGRQVDGNATRKFNPKELILSQAEAALAAGRVREARVGFDPAWITERLGIDTSKE